MNLILSIQINLDTVFTTVISGLITYFIIDLLKSRKL